MCSHSLVVRFLPVSLRGVESLAVEAADLINRSLSKNNYNADFMRRDTHRPVATTKTNHNATPTTTATISYIKGMYENILGILKPFNIHVAHKLITTLRQLRTNVKDKDEPKNRQSGLYEAHYRLGLCTMPNLQY